MSSSGEVEVWVGTTRSGAVGLAAAVLILAAAFFFVFPAASLVAALDLGLGFLGPAVFLVAVTSGCVSASVTGSGEGFGGGVLVALTTSALRRRDSTPHPGPSVRQGARPAKLSKQRSGLWWCSFGNTRALALQGGPSLLST